MSFTVKEVVVNESLFLFEMMEEYSAEVNFQNSNFTNIRSRFIKDCFEEVPVIKFLVAEFNGNTLGYCAFRYSYDVFNGPYIYINEIFVKKEYRKIGVAVFLISKIIDTAFDNKIPTVAWRVDILKKEILEIQNKAGAIVNDDLLILHISNDDIQKYLEVTPINKNIDVHFAKNYELTDIYECMVSLAKKTKREINTDVYKLMKDGFSMNPKFKMLSTTLNDEVVGFLSFYKSYNTCCGKSLIVDKVFVKEEYQNKGFGQALMTSLFDYANKNNFQIIESNISKFDVEEIEQLKEYGVFPYDNLRIVTFEEEAFKEIRK